MNLCEGSSVSIHSFYILIPTVLFGIGRQRLLVLVCWRERCVRVCEQKSVENNRSNQRTSKQLVDLFRSDAKHIVAEVLLDKRLLLFIVAKILDGHCLVLRRKPSPLVTNRTRTRQQLCNEQRESQRRAHTRKQRTAAHTGNHTCSGGAVLSFMLPTST